MEIEKTKLLISKEAQKVKAKGLKYQRKYSNNNFHLESETTKMLDKIRAETQSAVADIVMQEEIIVKEARQKIQQIESKLF